MTAVSTTPGTANPDLENITHFIHDTTFLLEKIENEDKYECINITHISQVHKCNVTVYYFYSSELLWFGAVSSLLLAVLGTALNFISILALLKTKRLRNATTAFVVNLCVSDMLFCGISMPLTAITLIHRNWINGDVMCKLFALIKNCNAIVSMFTVVAITMNRYILIVHRNFYRYLFAKRRTALMIGFLWFLPFALLSLPFFEIWGTLGYNPETGYCGVKYRNGKSPRNFIFVGSIILPSILFIGCYVKIYLVVRKSVRKSTRNVSRADVQTASDCQCISQRTWYRKNRCSCEPTDMHIRFKDREDRLLRVALAIFLTYVLTTVPLACVKVSHREYELQVLNILGYVAYFSSNTINPLIYIVMSKEYRRAYQDLFAFKRRSVSSDSCIKN